jgi:hypothetical protein
MTTATTDRHGPALVDTPQPPATGLLDLADLRLAAVLAESDSAMLSTLDSVMRRLFDPRDRDRLTVSAFASSL